MLDTVIFDFGNVLCTAWPISLLHKLFPSEEDLQNVTDVLYDRKYWTPLDIDEITDEQIVEEVTKQLPQKYHDAVRYLQEQWYTNLDPIDGMIDIVKDLKKAGKKVYILSNITSKMENYKNHYEVYRLVDGYVMSGAVKCMKPERKIFEILFQKYNINPQNAIFVDDLQNNIQAAQGIGLTGYCFDGNAQELRKYLESKKIL